MQGKAILDLFKRNQESKLVQQELSDQKQQSQIRCKSPNRLDMSFNNGSVIQGHEEDEQSECSVIDQIKGTYPEEIPTIHDTDEDEDYNDVFVSDFTSNQLPSQIEKMKKIICKNQMHQFIVLKSIDYPLYQFLDMSKQQMFYQPIQQLREKLQIIETIFKKKIKFYDDTSAEYKLSFQEQNELFVKSMTGLTIQKQTQPIDFSVMNQMIRNLQMYLKSNPIQISMNNIKNDQMSKISRIQLQQPSPVIYKVMLINIQKLNLKSMTLSDYQSNANTKPIKLEVQQSKNEVPQEANLKSEIDKQEQQLPSKIDKASRVCNENINFRIVTIQNIH